MREEKCGKEFTLSAARAPVRRCFFKERDDLLRGFRLNRRHELGPFRGFGLNEADEVGARPGARFGALLREARNNLRAPERTRERGGDAVDEFVRGSLGKHDAVPGGEFDVCNARFGKGRNVGSDRKALL